MNARPELTNESPFEKKNPRQQTDISARLLVRSSFSAPHLFPKSSFGTIFATLHVRLAFLLLDMHISPYHIMNAYSSVRSRTMFHVSWMRIQKWTAIFHKWEWWSIQPSIARGPDGWCWYSVTKRSRSRRSNVTIGHKHIHGWITGLCSEVARGLDNIGWGVGSVLRRSRLDVARGRDDLEWGVDSDC